MIVVVLAWVSTMNLLQAQAPPVHYNHAGVMPPGAIGSQQLLRGGPLPGYFQPVEIKGPDGSMIATTADGQFDKPEDGPLLVGLLIGSVYRLRVTNIPQQEGQEVFPTIEVIDRIYPPLRQEFQFPIPIELTQEELEIALSGRFVTRVIYLEDPNTAAPVARRGSEQSYFEVAHGENPLDVADSLGRPVAILRMGARVPGPQGPDETFLYGSPPMLKWRPCPPTPAKVSKPQHVGVPEKVRTLSARAPLGRLLGRRTAAP
jgi:hypothetical protein